jgi:cardiolipin synthase A/B
MEQLLAAHIQEIIRHAPSAWWNAVCVALRSSPATASADSIKKHMPTTSNADLALLLYEVIDAAVGQVSWEALGYGMQSAFNIHAHDQKARQLEMLWSGPSPAGHLPARRIDQALYDLIANAKEEILLVTFAAAKASEGQLTFDALKAFPSALVKTSEVYCWPLEKRERNQAGKPGKLHAKLAVVDDAVLLSSANLTDDAFSRNLELGVRLVDAEVVRWCKDHFSVLIKDSMIMRVYS